MSIVRLPASDPPPAWANQTAGFVSITRTAIELSIIAPEAIVPPGSRTSSGWRLFCVDQVLPLDIIGVLADISGALAEAGVNLMCVATHDTDYFLAPAQRCAAAADALRQAGYTVID